MKIITCASYYGTGSSAITDLLAEYENVKSLTDYELRFLQDPDGISELEYNLIDNHNRHNSGHALKRYQKLVDFYAGNIFSKKYENIFDSNWKKISYDYINSLIDFQFKGWWQFDLYDKGIFYYYYKSMINKLLHLTIWHNKNERYYNALPNEVTYCSAPTEEEFLKKTRHYINELFSKICDEKQYVMVDQIVPPSNLNRFVRYFDDIFIFVVERDPRDIYLLEKVIWKTNIIPVDNPNIFCLWYRYTRKHRKTESFPINTYFLYFEDLIYKYDETVSKIETLLELNNCLHVNKMKYLNPNISKKNTRLWETYTCYQEDIEYIQKELNEYLYDYNFLDGMD